MKLRKIFVVLLALVCLMGFGLSYNKVEAASETCTINFGTELVKINEQTINFTDSTNINWTSSVKGTTSFTTKPSYCQIGSSKSAASTITLTSSGFSSKSGYNLTNVKVKFGGFSGTAGTIAVKLGEEELKTGNLNAGNDVTIDSGVIKKALGSSEITISVTDISKGVKIYSIEYSFEYAATSSCAHTNKTTTAANAATCTENGNKEYTYCSDCQKYFSDSACQKEITLADTIAKATGHEFVNSVCSVCGLVKNTIDDVITADKLTATTYSYDDFSNVKLASGVVYSGNTATTGGAIQLRSNNSTSGIIVSNNNGDSKVRTITVSWNKETSNGRTLNIYGSNTAYSDATALYDGTTSGTILGSIINGESTSFTISGDYKYIGLRSNSGAIYLDSITIEWEVSNEGRINNFKAATPKASLQLVGEESNISGMKLRFGGVLCAGEYNSSAKYGVLVLTEELAKTSLTVSDIDSHKTNHTAIECTPVEVSGGYQFAWVLSNEIAKEDYAKPIYVYLYMVIDGNVYLTQVSTYTVKGIIEKYVDNTEIVLPESVSDYLIGLYVRN